MGLSRTLYHQAIRPLQRQRQGALCALGALSLCSSLCVAEPEKLITEELLITSPATEANSLQLTAALNRLDQTSLSRANVSHSRDLVKLAPALTALQSFNNRQSALLIRGLGTLVFNPAIEPSVITLVDGHSQGNAANGMSQLTDLHSVEIWRGPQITRFGRHAAAGAINLVSERAGERWQARIGAGVNNAPDLASGSIQASAFFGGPLSDNLGLRFGISAQDTDGFLLNAFDSTKLNSSKNQTIVAKFDLSTAGAFSASADYSYGESKGRCCAPVVSLVNSPQYAANLDPVNGSRENRASNTNSPFQSDTRDSVLHLRSHTLWKSGFSLDTKSAYSRYSERESQDFDFLPVDLIPLSKGFDKQTLLSQELRLSSPNDEPLEYSIGAYYEKTKHSRFYERGILGLFEASFEADLEQQNTNAFFQLNAKLNESLSLEGGLRYVHETIRFTAHRDAFPLQNLLALDGVRASERTGTVDGEAALHWQANPRSGVYLRMARGHKSPSYNLIFDLDSEAMEPVAKERSTSWELAYKRYLPRHGAYISATSFYTVFDDYQAQIQQTGSTKFQLINSGSIDTYGLELEGRWQHGRLNLHTSLDWTRARIGAVSGILCSVGEVQRGECFNGVRSLEGKPLPFAPEFKVNLRLGYALGTLRGFQFSFDTLYRWQSSMQTAFNNDRLKQEPAFGIWNIGVSVARQTINARLFVDNVLNKEFALAHFDNPVDAGGYVTFFSRDSVRLIGFNIQYEF